MRTMRTVAYAVLMVAGYSSTAYAMDRLRIDDASAVQYAVTNDNRVYLRNLSEFDASWLGCCEAYYIDASTDYGRAQLAALMTAKYAHAPISLYLDKAGGEVVQIGDF